jgi:hypothetical protein
MTWPTSRDEEEAARSAGYFPRRFLTDFLKFIRDHSADINLLTYDSLPWGDDSDYEGGYPEELARWKQGLRSGQFDRRKAHVLIQYDVDSRAERTMALLATPEHNAIPANTMIFNRCIDRVALKNHDILRPKDYKVDYALLGHLENHGFVIGYHSNAVERAHFDLERALVIFFEDMDELSARFKIRFFSAHGGVVGPNGEKNRSLQIPRDRRSGLWWVHNGISPRFRASFSDGGHNRTTVAPKERDLRDFVRRFQPAERYRILIHPQYYDLRPHASKSFSGTLWYDELLVRAATDTSSLWSDVRLAEAAR